MDDLSWKQRGLVLLSILVMTLIGLAINKAPAGEQTRFYGPDGRTVGTATTSGNTTTFYGADGRRTGSATATGKP
jgi:YD repeat-containing protein